MTLNRTAATGNFFGFKREQIRPSGFDGVGLSRLGGITLHYQFFPLDLRLS
jgi:hypothetical protein